MSEVYAGTFGDPEVDAHLSDRALIQRHLDAELALVDAQAALGLIAPDIADTVRRSVGRAEDYDLEALAKQSRREGNLVVPLIRAVRARVTGDSPQASAAVHRGATSQDIIDTATVLQLRATVPVITRELRHAAAAARRHAAAHATTPMAGRTWLQQATPTTFGLTAAGWADALDRVSDNIAAALDRAMVVQLGGATGTLAAFGEAGPRVARAFADRLKLDAPDLPWHGHRDRVASLACAIAVALGTVGKIGRDIALLAQTELGELTIDRGGGGSSTMPHKQNPVGSAVMIAAALRAPGLVATLLAAMPQELERGLGGWQTEWTTLPELVSVAGGSARAAEETLEALVVHPERMQANLGVTLGVTLAEAVSLALADHIGRERAHDVVEAAARRALAEHRSLASTLAEDTIVTAILDPPALERLTRPEHHLGAAAQLVARIVERARS